MYIESLVLRAIENANGYPPLQFLESPVPRGSGTLDSPPHARIVKVPSMLLHRWLWVVMTSSTAKMAVICVISK